jgi:hypothetical protein
VIAFLALAAHDSRRRSRAAGSIDNLRFIGAGTQSYAADNADSLWTLSWRAGAQQTEYPDLNNASTDLIAAANQAVYIMRRLGGMPQVQRPFNWVPHILYSHLPLVEHLGASLPSRVFVSPEDRNRLSWQRDAAGFLALPNIPPGGSEALRWIFSSSYETGPAFWSADAIANGQQTVTQSNQHYAYQVPNLAQLGRRTLSEVRFPSSKAHYWETHQRDLAVRVPFFAIPFARVPVLTVDGSAQVRSAEYTNRGFKPNSPADPSPTQFTYLPDNWEPPAMNTSNTQGDVVIGRMRWTRWGLRGRDFNGPQVTAP